MRLPDEVKHVQARAASKSGHASLNSCGRCQWPGEREEQRAEDFIGVSRHFCGTVAPPRWRT